MAIIICNIDFSNLLSFFWLSFVWLLSNGEMCLHSTVRGQEEEEKEEEKRKLVTIIIWILNALSIRKLSSGIKQQQQKKANILYDKCTSAYNPNYLNERLIMRTANELCICFFFENVNFPFIFSSFGWFGARFLAFRMLGHPRHPLENRVWAI